jgi:hypothetical protein
VATPPEVVKAMLDLARIGPDDVIYEPGCGDARILIAAVLSGARRGVGVDIDPRRVADARENVEKSNLEEKVEIRLGDALEITDLSDATVVFLYMGNEFNMLLRPILWKQLPVGARVVSHRFTMGDWTPDRTATVGIPTFQSLESGLADATTTKPALGIGISEEIYRVHVWTVTPEIKARAEREAGIQSDRR